MKNVMETYLPVSKTVRILVLVKVWELLVCSNIVYRASHFI